MIDSLIVPIIDVEIKDVLFSIPDNKSPWSDSFTSLFVRGLGKLYELILKQQWGIFFYYQ